jgi:CAAX protease family protein
MAEFEGNLLRRYRLICFFLIAFALSWTVVAAVVLLGLGVNALVISAITAGPAVSALFLTSANEGRAGVMQLLCRLLLWRVAARWYLFALVGIPVLYVTGTAVLPGAWSSFEPLSLKTWLSYLWLFPLVLVVGGPLLEEIGWRGFALGPLEERFGPLGGTLLLGLLWAVWHYPQYALPDWAAQNGGFTVQSIVVFTLGVVAITVIMTWMFNHTRGSLLLAVLAHSTINTFSAFIGPMFPAQAGSQINGLVGFGGAALIILVLTRGRLGYGSYVGEEKEATPSPGRRGA